MTDDEEELEEEFNVPPPAPKLKSLQEAIQSLEDIKVYLEDHGLFDQATAATDLLQLASSHASSLTQLTLHHFFDQT